MKKVRMLYNNIENVDWERGGGSNLLWEMSLIVPYEWTFEKILSVAHRLSLLNFVHVPCSYRVNQPISSRVSFSLIFTSHCSMFPLIQSFHDNNHEWRKIVGWIFFTHLIFSSSSLLFVVRRIFFSLLLFEKQLKSWFHFKRKSEVDKLFFHYIIVIVKCETF